MAKYAYLYVLRYGSRSYYVGLTGKLFNRAETRKLGPSSLRLHGPVEFELLEGPFSEAAAVAREASMMQWPPAKMIKHLNRSRTRCARLREKIFATGADAIGGPPEPDSLHTARELSHLLSFIRYDEETDAPCQEPIRDRSG